MAFETQAIRSIKEFKEISLQKIQVILFLLLTFLFFIKSFDYNFFVDLNKQFMELMAHQYLKKVLLVFVMIMHFLAYLVIVGWIITVFLLLIYHFYWEKITCYKLNRERWYAIRYITELSVNLSTFYLLILVYLNVLDANVKYTTLLGTAGYFAVFFVFLFFSSVMRFLIANTDD
ncbi:hypothetical protein COL26_26305 [Bacillus thuringiensis]|uniref:Uncharacterized protein n=1 Tax=Bacillus thuringiensis TaxID=1428 RepID=A0ABD6S783_BACTU|nr:hypothetical protein [Bacillus thuringiensis]PER53655.1 hypothetical protein CN495_12645 [Bacillus thuringiensis]PEU84319.1 hypothetical protein CN411_22210 [Bacillus thuringiensis]PFI13636.1 hypothetical protein COI79_00120 [Bacillus thuringiensis]PFW30696.1 hypothetical protein COL26_26305 [Bacillus thuringiensis]PGY75184.1 hypothetical protein COE44_20610 [Bacillus thuringiensis]